MSKKVYLTIITAGVALLGVLLLLVFKTESFPLVIQQGYYSVAYKVTFAQNNPKLMKKVHEATKTRAEQKKNPYSFYYSQKDKEVIRKDSMLCRSCHGSMKQKENGKAKYPIHNKMLNVEIADFFCTNCHKKVDLGKRTTRRATIRVDRNLCTKCHEENKKVDLKELKQIQKKINKEDPNLFLVVRHGTDKKSGLAWVKEHQIVAKSVGVKKCRRCHKIGTELDFCTDCHPKQPR